MGLSSSKSKTTTDQKTSETGSTVPVNPPWVTDAIEEYTGRLGTFGDMDPNAFVAGAAPLQRMAWDNVGSLADWQGQARTASQLALGAGQAPPSLAGNHGADALTVPPAAHRAPAGEIKRRAGSGAAPVPAGPQGPAFGYAPATGQAAAYQAPQLGEAALVQARGYAAPSLGPASGYAAPRVGAPIGAQAFNYSAQPAAKETVAPAAQATASNANAESLLAGFRDYYDPFAESVVKTTLADYDRDAGRRQAALQAEGARNGAFGGSRFGIAQAELDGEIARGRAATQAALRSQAFERAAALSGEDAGRRQQAGQFNAAGQTDVSRANAAAANERSLAQAGLNQSVNLANAEEVNRQRAFGAAAGNDASMFNAGQGNQAALAQAGLDADAGRFGAEARNRFALEQAGLNEQAGQLNAQLAAGSDADNQAARNQFALAQAGFDRDAGQSNAAARNAFALAGMDAANEAARWNAGADNQMAQFDAGQRDAAAARQLEAAGLLGNLANAYAGNVRADLGTMGDLGAQQRAIEAQYAMAPLAQLQALGELYGATPYSLFSGQNVSTNGTLTGTNVTRQTPSLFNSILEAAQTAAKLKGK